MIRQPSRNPDQPQLPFAVGAAEPISNPVTALIKAAAQLTGLSERALSAPGGLEYAEVTLRLGKMGCVNCAEPGCSGCGS